MRFFPYAPLPDPAPDPVDYDTPDGWKAHPCAVAYSSRGAEFTRFVGPSPDGWVSAEMASGQKWIVGRIIP